MMTALLGSMGLIVLAVVFLAIARAGVRGTLPHNGIVGIRTPATKASDEAWVAGHRAAAPLMRVAGVVALVAIPALFVAAFATRGRVDHGEPVVFGVEMLAYLVTLGLAIAATLKANEAARAA